MKINVVGVGFVGGTVADFLTENNIEVVRVDPKYYPTTLYEGVSSSDGSIVCLPTPQAEDGSCDASLVKKVIDEIVDLDSEHPILLKSTVAPHLLQQLNDNVVYNPEFLRELHAMEDFKNQGTCIIGSHKNCIPKMEQFWFDLFDNLLNTNMWRTDRNTASMVKYVHNTWLSTKVAFFHDLYRLNENMLGTEDHYQYEDMIKILSNFDNIGPSHMQAPNDQGQLGYGGHCFPKDTTAFINYFQQKNQKLDILETVDSVNNKLKKKDDKMLEFIEAVPDEPYLLFVGTSHTYGECDKVKVDYTFNNYIGENLGYKTVCVGLSGARQNEFVQIFNELIYCGYLGKNCKGVFFESRITDNTFEFDFEEILDFKQVKSLVEEQNLQDVPLINRTSLGIFHKDKRDDKRILYNRSANNFLYGFGSQDQLNVDDIKTLVGDLNRTDPEEVMETVDDHDVKKLRDILSYNLAFKNKTTAQAHKDIQIVDIIKNLVTAKDIPFGWFVIDNRNNLLENAKLFIQNKSDVFDYLLLGQDLYSIIDAVIDETDTEHLKCGCGHFNKKGNILAGELLLPEVERTLNNVR